MKIKAILVCLALASVAVQADDVVGMNDENPKTYTLDKFKKEIGLTPVKDQLIRLKFEYRTPNFSDGPHGSKQGTVEARKGWSSLQVNIPADGLAWFSKVPTLVNYDSLNVKSFTVYARVTIPAEGQPTIRLVGNEITRDLTKETIVWH